jgi:hypothetical protein
MTMTGQNEDTLKENPPSYLVRYRIFDKLQRLQVALNIAQSILCKMKKRFLFGIRGFKQPRIGERGFCD